MGCPTERKTNAPKLKVFAQHLILPEGRDTKLNVWETNTNARFDKDKEMAALIEYFCSQLKERRELNWGNIDNDLFDAALEGGAGITLDGKHVEKKVKAWNMIAKFLSQQK